MSYLYYIMNENMLINVIFVIYIMNENMLINVIFVLYNEWKHVNKCHICTI